ncbi:hypothetical protein WMY93_013416 [Mugilogobius chulae]|uniref:Uncharacterized protein n=1 Tax=Mugilogobius chulae TaxID=88201 RepID=A0AAW0NZF1_9GOBI
MENINLILQRLINGEIVTAAGDQRNLIRRPIQLPNGPAGDDEMILHFGHAFQRVWQQQAPVANPVHPLINHEANVLPEGFQHNRGRLRQLPYLRPARNEPNGQGFAHAFRRVRLPPVPVNPPFLNPGPNIRAGGDQVNQRGQPGQHLYLGPVGDAPIALRFAHAFQNQRLPPVNFLPALHQILEEQAVVPEPPLIQDEQAAVDPAVHAAPLIPDQEVENNRFIHSDSEEDSVSDDEDLEEEEPSPSPRGNSNKRKREEEDDNEDGPACKRRKTMSPSNTNMRN